MSPDFSLVKDEFGACPRTFPDLFSEAAIWAIWDTDMGWTGRMLNAIMLQLDGFSRDRHQGWEQPQEPKNSTPPDSRPG